MKNRLVSGAPSKAFAVHAGAVIAGPTIAVAGTTGRLLEPAAARTRTIPATVDRAPAQTGSGPTGGVALRSVLPETASVPGATFRAISRLPAEGAGAESTAYRG